MAQGDGTSVDVDPVHVDAEVLHHGHDLGGEGLVQLEEVHVADRHAGAAEHLLAGRHWAESHDLRGQAAEAGRDDAGQRRDAELSRFGIGHDHHRGRAVVEGAAVAGGDRAVLAEDWLELLERVQGDAEAGSVVGRDDRSVGEGDRSDVQLPEALGDRLLGEILAAQRERVLRPAGHPTQPGHVLGGVAHGQVDVRQLILLARVVP
jgi:hypothetical protein